MGGFVFGEGFPDEIRVQIERQMDEAKMVSEAVRNSIRSMISELNPEQLLAIRYMLTIVQNNPEQAFVYEGMLISTLEFKFDVCGGCGLNHAEHDLLNVKPEETLDPDTELLQVYYVKRAEHGAVECLNCRRLFGGLDDRMIFGTGKEGCPSCHGADITTEEE